jgi:hypothetical protein
MSDLVERLRLFEASGPAIPSCQLFGEAADEIERLHKRHDDFLQEFWATNALNAKLDAKIDRLNGALARADAKCVKLTGDIQVLKLQRDATHVSRCPNCGDGDWWFNE